MLKIYNIKEKQEFLREVAILTQKEWGSKTDSEEEFEAKINKKISKIINNFDNPLYCKLILLDDEIREAINKNIDRIELKHLIYKKNVKTLLQDGLIKVLEGITDLKEVLRLVDYDESDDLFSASSDIEYAKVDKNTSVMNSDIISNDAGNETFGTDNNMPQQQDENSLNKMTDEIVQSAPADTLFTNKSLQDVNANIDMTPSLSNNSGRENTLDNNFSQIPIDNDNSEFKRPYSDLNKDVINIPNYSNNSIANNEIIEPVNNNNIFDSKPKGNLFEDNVFNSLRINNSSGSNTGSNNLNNDISNDNNYTNNLINLIDNELKG